MRVLIVGATGGTGQRLVEQTLERGHETSALIHHHPEKLARFTSELTTHQGDVRDGDFVDAAVQGQDAVLVALGVTPGRTRHQMSAGTANVVRSMLNHGVRRLVVETGAGLTENPTQIPRMWRLVLKLPPMRAMFADKRRQEAVVKNSGLEWVIVRPANLTDGPPTTDYRAGVDLTLRTSSTISRADVADFMVRQVTVPDWLGKAVLVERSWR